MYMRLYLHVFYKVATVANKQCKIDFAFWIALSSNVFSTPSCVNRSIIFVLMIVAATIKELLQS